jgi:S1-C subfamily serine protease
VDGVPVRVFGDFLSYLMTNKSPGDQIVLTIIREGEEMEVNLTLAKRP